MKIHNVRLWFATNSSSTHSIIFIKPKQSVKDSGCLDYEFGWDFWTAASQVTKRQYVALQLYSALKTQVNEDIATAVVKDWVGCDLDLDGRPGGLIDHQSLYDLPASWDGMGVDYQFFKEFCAFLMRDDVAILGGNDNDYNSDGTPKKHPLSDGAFVLPISRDCGNTPTTVCRKDPLGYWTLFDRRSGAKIRFSFSDLPGTKPPQKATYPELVDLKITDFCPYDCKYCYQGSTTAGKHAETRTVYNIASILGDMRVFEVAIGGGEPTLHPDFIKILNMFRSYGVVPNFTTKNLSWLRDPAKVKDIMSRIGGFAFSVDDEKDIPKLSALLEINDIDREKVSIQYVMGTSSLYGLERITRECHKHMLKLTLLGYKHTHRGGTFKPYQYDKWLDTIKKLRDEGVLTIIGIDTSLAKESEDALKKAKIEPVLYSTEEGKFSMYIDAVDYKMGPSSYVDDLAMKRVKEFTAEEIKNSFSRW
jgi:hypothetical protein